ncbi:HTH-type transcriptional regulator CdhR [Marinobacter szutsaonensis]
MTEPETRKIGFLAIPQFSMLSFVAALEPLRAANRLSEQPLYEWHIFSQDNQPVAASNGLPISPDRRFDETGDIDLMIVVAGIGTTLIRDKKLFEWLRQLSRRGVALGATSTGSLLLARARLLSNHRCTIHWENKESFEEEFPELNMTGELYEIDGNIMTCSGGLASLDMMCHKIALEHGADLAMGCAEQFIHPQIRPANEKQRMELQFRHNTNHPRLLKVIQLMQNHTEDVLSCSDIGEKVGLSIRQMERLFRTHLRTTPNAFYMELRLERARHLLLQSTMSITQIATACGFNSTSYFTRCYTKGFGLTPREQRQKRTQG